MQAWGQFAQLLAVAGHGRDYLVLDFRHPFDLAKVGGDGLGDVAGQRVFEMRVEGEWEHVDSLQFC